MINDVNNFLLRERGAVTKARPQQFYVCIYVCRFSGHNLRYGLFVYRLIGATLIGFYLRSLLLK